MEPAQRKAAMPAVQVRRPPAPEAWLDEGSVDELLEAGVGDADSDPVIGIRNAVIAGAAIWIAVGLLIFAYAS